MEQHRKSDAWPLWKHVMVGVLIAHLIMGAIGGVIFFCAPVVEEMLVQRRVHLAEQAHLKDFLALDPLDQILVRINCPDSPEGEICPRAQVEIDTRKRQELYRVQIEINKRKAQELRERGVID